MTRLLRALLAVALITTVLAAPAAAQGNQGTILYIEGGNVWMSTPDGGQRHQVTADGGWDSPSMADDGTILAVKGGNTPAEDQLVRLAANGQVLSAFTPDLLFDGGVVRAQIHPEGELAYYVSSEFCPGPDGRIRVCSITGLVHADGRSTAVLGSVDNRPNAAWIPQTRFVAINGVDYFGVGDTEPQDWFFGPTDAFDFSSDLSLAADAFDDISFFQLSGPPPAEGTELECRLVDERDGVFDGLSMSPSGDSLVVSYRTGDDAEVTEVAVLRGVDPHACTIQADVTLTTTGSDPFWSAAAFDPSGGGGPGPGPTPPPPGGGSTPPSPDEPLTELLDGNRVDGGGSADPVGQTVVTSQEVWADGGAALVVLATADRFPDALAGSALAGELGPILVTPFGEQLDTRVDAEIRRVLGSEGVVVILGGAAAVSEGAAAQARAAAGITGCPAPFPADCRYAGSGREHTAALIGETVLELHGGSGGRALLARGDVFADAITGGAYAAEAGVPILLTPPDQLNGSTEAFITANGIVEVIVLGGTAAVSQATVDAVPVLTRRIAGGERTATAAAIATELWQAEGIGGGGVVLVNVRDDGGWQTALAAAVVSALANAPQLGVEGPPAGVSEATVQAAGQLGGPVETFGSAALVSDAQLQTVRQAAG